MFAGGDSEETIFHLHGYKFYIIGYRNFGKPTSLNTIRRLNEEGLLLKRNFVSPVIKDTVRVPKFSAVVVRFIASNPGEFIRISPNLCKPKKMLSFRLLDFKR